MAYVTGGRIVLKYDTDHWVEEVSPKESRSFVITNPTANSDLPLWRIPYAITVKAIHVLTPVGVIVGNLWSYDENGLDGGTVDADITTTAATNTNDDGSLTSPSIGANKYVGWKTTSVSGTPTYAIVTFEYTID